MNGYLLAIIAGARKDGLLEPPPPMLLSAAGGSAAGWRRELEVMNQRQSDRWKEKKPKYSL